MNNKIIIIIFALIISFLSLTNRVKAADLVITCNGSSCASTSGSLFNETNIAPGFSVTKSMLIDNTSNSDSCNLHLFANRQGEKQNSDLAERINTVINGNVYGSLANIFGQDIYLGVVNANSTREYSWTANFLSDSGNDYQDKSVTFNFNLNFTCGTVVNNTITPNPTLTSVPGNNEQNFQTTSFTSVLGISSDNIVNTDNTVILSDLTLDSGNILGIECQNTNNNWWIVLLVQTIISLIVLAFKAIKPLFLKLWILPLLFGLLSQIIHGYYGCGCSADFWCDNYIYLNLIVVFLAFFSYYLIVRKKTLV